MNQKIVINRCFGGFGLSELADRALAKRKGVTLYELNASYGVKTFATVPKEEYERLERESRVKRDLSLVEGLFWNSMAWGRDDPDLVAVVEELGETANGVYSELKVVEVPYGVLWDINEYDGIEWVAEKHRTWS